MDDRATETMALPKPPVWLPSSCHWIRNAVNSAVLTTASQAAISRNGFGKEAPVCSTSRKHEQKADRDTNNSCFFPLHARLGRTNNPCSWSQLLTFWEGDAVRECQLQVSPDFFHPAFSAQHMAPQHPPHFSSPGPTSVFLNSTPDLLESECIPRDAPRIQGRSLPTPSFTPDYVCLDNNPQASTLLSAKGGRLCIKGSVLKREEYFPMKNQHPHKTKS